VADSAALSEEGPMAKSKQARYRVVRGHPARG